MSLESALVGVEDYEFKNWAFFERSFPVQLEASGSRLHYPLLAKHTQIYNGIVSGTVSNLASPLDTARKINVYNLKKKKIRNKKK